MIEPASKIIYVCSPHGGSEKNIKRNGEYCRYVIDAGKGKRHIPVSPHFNFRYLDEATERDVALELCEGLIVACDVVYMFIGNGKTEGMIKEEEYARSIGKPVKFFGDMTPPVDITDRATISNGAKLLGAIKEYCSIGGAL